MSQDLSLIKAMWNRVNPLAKPEKNPDAKAANPDIQGPQRKPASIDPSLIGTKQGGASTPSPFQAKVQESHAKLAAKTTPMKNDQSRAHLINPADSKSPQGQKESKVDRHDHAAKADKSDKSDKSDKTDKADRAEKPGRTQAKGRKDKPDQAGTDGKTDPDSKVEADAGQDRNIQDTGKETRASGNPVEGRSEADGSRTDEGDGDAKAALQDRLERMGISATDEQLNDPAFLRDMLRLVQASEPTAAPEDSAVTDAVAAPEDMMPAAPVAQTNALPVDVAVATDAGVAVPAETAAQAPTPVAAEIKNPLATREPDQKDLANLIKDRLAELAKSPETAAPSGQSQGASGNIRPGAPAEPVNQGWRGMRLGRDAQSITTDPMPTADLDRMRVMQAAAMQAVNVGDAKDHVDLSAADSIDTADNGMDVETVQTSASSDKAATAQDNGADAEDFGQNPNRAQAAEGTAGTPGTQGLRETTAGPQFHQTMNQIRSAEHKPAAENIWAPQATHFEKGVMDQISKKMSGIAHLNGEEISIQLEPENLGKIRVGLGLKDGIMNARIGVESEQIKQIVEANLSSLRDTLEGQGIKLQGLEVTVDQRHSSLFNPDGSNSQSFFNRHGRAGEGGADGSGIPALESAPESETGRRLGYNTMEYIA